MPFHNPTEGVHEHFYSNGKCHTRIIIAPKNLLTPPQNDTYQQSICSTYSLSHMPLSRQNSPYQDEKFLTSYHHLAIATRPSTLTQTTSIMLLEPPCLSIEQKTALASFVEKIKNEQTEPLLSSSTIAQTRKLYGLTDTTPNS